MEAKPDNCCVIDESGMIIEKAPSFPSNIAGDLKDIMAKAKSIFDNEDNLTVEIMYDNMTSLLKDDHKITYCSMVHLNKLIAIVPIIIA